jgi:hypothetical protein
MKSLLREIRTMGSVRGKELYTMIYVYLVTVGEIRKQVMTESKVYC